MEAKSIQQHISPIPYPPTPQLGLWNVTTPALQTLLHVNSEILNRGNSGGARWPVHHRATSYKYELELILQSNAEDATVENITAGCRSTLTP